jgi:hypothetical protein
MMSADGASRSGQNTRTWSAWTVVPVHGFRRRRSLAASRPEELASLSQDGNGCLAILLVRSRERARPAVLAVRGDEPRRGIHYHSLLSGVLREAGM